MERGRPAEPAAATWAVVILEKVIAGFRRAGRPASRFPPGILVEIPAAPIGIDRSVDSDFSSIGSNDLTQYVTAASRGIASVSALADPCGAAVVRSIENVARVGRTSGREVHIRGDAASDTRGIGAMLHAGVRRLSVDPDAIADVRRETDG